MSSALFASIETMHGEAAWGSVLDAGTGPRSLQWLTKLDTNSIAAVTATAAQAARLKSLPGLSLRPGDRVLAGNWNDPDFLAGETFDTVVADYLLGAVERFAPFFQSALFLRLRPLTGKRLYVTGVEPYVIGRPVDAAGALVWELGRYRDSCLTLLGESLHREYPLDWVLSELRRSGFKPGAVRKVATRYKADFVNGQVAIVRPGLQRLADKALGAALIAHGEALRDRALAHIESQGSLSHGFAYAIAADPA